MAVGVAVVSATLMAGRPAFGGGQAAAGCSRARTPTATHQWLRMLNVVHLVQARKLVDDYFVKVGRSDWLALHPSESNSTMKGPRVAHTARGTESGPLSERDHQPPVAGLQTCAVQSNGVQAVADCRPWMPNTPPSQIALPALRKAGNTQYGCPFGAKFVDGELPVCGQQAVCVHVWVGG